MKVTMLGRSDAGKTTYMAAMYAVMNGQHQSRRGFGVIAANGGDHESLLRLGQRITREGDYPSATDVRGEYAFSLTLNGSVVLPFTWVDHRGGALYESTGAASQLDTLLADLRDSDAILVFLDAPTLVHDADGNADIGRLAAVLGNLLGERLPPPIAFVVSKADVLLPAPETPPSAVPVTILFAIAVALTFFATDSTGLLLATIGGWAAGLVALYLRAATIGEQSKRRQAALRTVIERAAVPLDGLIGAIHASTELQGGLIATGCSRHEMINVDKPMLFALRFGIETRVARLRALIADLESNAGYYESRSSLWDSLRSTFSGVTSNAKHARLMREKAATEHGRVVQLQPAAESLRPRIRDFILF